MINKKNVIIAFITLVVVVIGSICFLIFGKPDFELKYSETYPVTNPFSIGSYFKIGGFSDLFFYNNHLYAITDRGPNTDIENQKGRDIRNFPLSTNYHPYLVEFELKNNEAKITKTRNLDLTGIPIAEEKDCYPLDKNNNDIPFDKDGVDSEALAVDRFAHFWIGDEYYPSILEFDKDLKLLNRYAPKNSIYKSETITYNLPEEFVDVQKNLGFEAMTYDGEDHIFIFTQSSLKNGKTVKIIKFNIVSKQVDGIYDYSLGNGEKDIISAAVCLSSTEILTAERRNGEHQLRVLTLIPQIVNYSKPVLLLKGMHGINKYHKIEGLAYNGKDTVYIINDNDFGIDTDNRQDSFIMEFKMNRKNRN